MGGVEATIQQKETRSDANDPLTPEGRHRLITRVLTDGRPIAHVAAEAGIARSNTAQNWVVRRSTRAAMSLPQVCPSHRNAPFSSSTGNARVAGPAVVRPKAATTSTTTRCAAAVLNLAASTSNHARGGKGQILLGELVVEHGQILHLFRGALEPGLADPPTR